MISGDKNYLFILIEKLYLLRKNAEIHQQQAANAEKPKE